MFDLQYKMLHMEEASWVMRLVYVCYIVVYLYHASQTTLVAIAALSDNAVEKAVVAGCGCSCIALRRRHHMHLSRGAEDH